MKRIISILLTISLLASALMCLVSCKFEKDDDDRTSSKKDKKHSYISQEQKNTWHDKLYALLLKSDIHDSELGLLGSYAAGLMDFDFDNTPELVLAYHGGSMGNLPLEIYDINTGEKLADYDSSIYNENNTACIYVAQKDSEYVILSETAFRIPPLDSASFISTISADKDSDFIKSTNLFYKETFDNETSTIYKHLGQSVDKDEYDEKYQQFLEDYKKIDGTQLQLFQWSTFGKLEWTDLGEKEGVDPESRQDLVKKMTFALLHSSQKFIEYDIIDNAESNEELTDSQESENTETETKTELSEKYPDVPKALESILDAYIEIAYLNRYEGYHSREKIEDAKYPGVTSDQLDCIFNSLMDGWRNGGYGYYAGYAAKDINGDGINELFLTDVEYSIYAMFTLANGEIISHYFDFSFHKSVTRIDKNGNFYYSDYGKGESIQYEISRLGTDGNLYRTVFGHYDMTGFGDPEVYNYFSASEIEISDSLIDFSKIDSDRLTDEEYNGIFTAYIISDEEYNSLVSAYREAIEKLKVFGYDPNEEAIKAIGLKFHQVIIEDQRK